MHAGASLIFCRDLRSTTVKQNRMEGRKHALAVQSPVVIGLSDEPSKRDVKKYRSEPETNIISLPFTLVVMITTGMWREVLLQPISAETSVDGTESSSAAEKQQDPVGLLELRMCKVLQLYLASKDLF